MVSLQYNNYNTVLVLLSYTSAEGNSKTDTQKHVCTELYTLGGDIII